MRKLVFILLTLYALACFRTSADSSVDSREVTVFNPGAGISLAGTLTVPKNPKALLVMASGSGAQNRDEELMGHRPFRTIADFLASRGYATLRMDDRGVGGSQGSCIDATTADFVTDMSAAIALADSILPGAPMGVLGHSEGGAVAVRTANADPRCSFIVTLGAPAWRGDSIVMSQARALSVALAGRWDGEALQRKIMDIAGSDMNNTQARLSIYTLMAEALGPQMAAMPAVQAQLNQQVEAVCSPWYRAFISYDPQADIAAVAVSWLALNGDKDFQVLPENLAAIASLNPRVTTRLMPGHNHLLQRCSTGFPQEYASIAEDISPEALAAIADWLDSTISRH